MNVSFHTSNSELKRMLYRVASFSKDELRLRQLKDGQRAVFDVFQVPTYRAPTGGCSGQP